MSRRTGRPRATSRESLTSFATKVAPTCVNSRNAVASRRDSLFVCHPQSCVVGLAGCYGPGLRFAGRRARQHCLQRTDMRGGANIGIPADAIAQQFRPQLVIVCPAKFQQVGMWRHCGKQPEECLLGDLLAPVQSRTTDQSQRVRILSCNLPHETERG